MQKIYQFITSVNWKVDDWFSSVCGKSPVLYWSLMILSKLIIWGGLACILASITGTKKYIDKKMKWAQR